MRLDDFNVSGIKTAIEIFKVRWRLFFFKSAFYT